MRRQALLTFPRTTGKAWPCDAMVLLKTFVVCLLSFSSALCCGCSAGPDAETAITRCIDPTKWRAKPLRSFETIVDLIGNTRTAKGLRVNELP